jgi:dTDP-glucose pyrophosphorylase
MATWKDVVVSPETSLREAVTRVNSSGLQVALVLSDDGRLAGILTDGNIRRALLAGVKLEGPVSAAMAANPTSVPETTAAPEILAIMRRLSIHHVPLVDDDGRVVGLRTLDELMNPEARPNWVVLMAGGLGTRLHPLTADRPKPLLSVGGKPVLETIVGSFAEQGFKRIFLSVNFKAEMIREHFGDGNRWGVEVEYLHETTRLGTAGALSLLPERPTAPFVVMNGDLLTHANFDNLLRFHQAQGAAATMVVREYDFQVPYGVVDLDGTRIVGLQERPVHRFFVNAGIYALSPEVLEYLPREAFFDMPTLFERLMADGHKTAAYPLWEYWLDIGRLEEFERAQREWSHS